MYQGVRNVLQKYRSGKLPKAFKMIPHLQNWEQILYITEPTTWSAAAMYQVLINEIFLTQIIRQSKMFKVTMSVNYIQFVIFISGDSNFCF